MALIRNESKRSVYKQLTTTQFTNLCRSVGGTTLADITAIKEHEDPTVRGFWSLFNLPHSRAVREDQDLVDALSMFEALGFLPNGVQAVLDAWPTE